MLISVGIYFANKKLFSAVQKSMFKNFEWTNGHMIACIALSLLPICNVGFLLAAFIIYMIEVNPLGDWMNKKAKF